MKKLISKFWFKAVVISFVGLTIVIITPKKLEMKEIAKVDNQNLYKMVDKETYLYVFNETLEIEEEEVVETLEVSKPVEVVPVIETIEEPEEVIIEEVVAEETPVIEEVSSANPLTNAPIIDSFAARLSAYGPDCSGCRGITNSGYDVRQTIYYNDVTYGNLRIIAADYSVLPLGSVVKITNFKYSTEPIYAIVLDKGGSIVGNRLDLLYESETLEIVRQIGITDVTCEIIRKGY